VHARPLVLPHHARWLLLEVVPASHKQQQQEQQSTTIQAVTSDAEPLGLTCRTHAAVTARLQLTQGRLHVGVGYRLASK
jgi:hypothetical protein